MEVIIVPDAESEVLTWVNIQVEVLWVVMPHGVVVGYQHFGGPGASIFRVKCKPTGRWV
jgi:hypothetical protein